jgi:hypothetical protein
MNVAFKSEWSIWCYICAFEEQNKSLVALGDVVNVLYNVLP